MEVHEFILNNRYRYSVLIDPEESVLSQLVGTGHKLTRASSTSFGAQHNVWIASPPTVKSNLFHNASRQISNVKCSP